MGREIELDQNPFSTWHGTANVKGREGERTHILILWGVTVSFCSMWISHSAISFCGRRDSD